MQLWYKSIKNNKLISIQMFLEILGMKEEWYCAESLAVPSQNHQWPILMSFWCWKLWNSKILYIQVIFTGFGNKSTWKLLRAPGVKKHKLISSQFWCWKHQKQQTDTHSLHFKGFEDERWSKWHRSHCELRDRSKFIKSNWILICRTDTN